MEMVLQENNLKFMWVKIKSSWENVKELDVLKESIIKFDNQKEARHFNFSGKKFFYNLKNIFFLRFLLGNIREPILQYYKNPVIDHVFVLSKSPGGNATPPHQDVTFWYQKEKTYLPDSLITFWLPLIDVDKSNGALNLIPNDRTNNIKELNTKKNDIKNFVRGTEDEGFNNKIINPSDLKELEVINLKKGEWIAFDAYSIHSSTGNFSTNNRIALKIVVAEKEKINRKILGSLNIKTITSEFSFISYFYLIYWITIKGVLSILKKFFR